MASPWKQDRPTSRAAFEARFPDEAACAAHRFARRLAAGFVCPACGGRKGFFSQSGKRFALECAGCGRQTSVTAGTVMALIDLDGMKLGDPGIDVGRFPVSLGIPSLRELGDLRAIQRARSTGLDLCLMRLVRLDCGPLTQRAGQRRRLALRKPAQILTKDERNICQRAELP